MRSRGGRDVITAYCWDIYSRGLMRRAGVRINWMPLADGVAGHCDGAAVPLVHGRACTYHPAVDGRRQAGAVAQVCGAGGEGSLSPGTVPVAGQQSKFGIEASVARSVLKLR
jgi:hypothetical protein